MSETDDTDILLLIPPNFFLVHSSGSEDSLLESSRTVVHKPVSCTAQVLDKLVNQVHTLESRLVSLETSSDISSIERKSKRKILDTTDSFESHSLDRKAFTFPRRRRRKTQRRASKRDLSLTSLDSVSTHISIPPLKLNITRYPKSADGVNDTRSMDGDISSIVSTPNKKNDKLLLNEIDEFLTKVESYESPETKYKDQYDSFTPENIIKAAGDYITHKMDSKQPNQYDDDQIKLPSGRIVSSSVLDKYIYLVKGNPPPEIEKPLPTKSQFTDSLHSSKQHNDSVDRTIELPKHDLIKTRQEEMKSPSIRRLSFSEKNVQPTSTPKKPTTSTTRSYLDTFRPTSNKIYDRATKVLEQYKAQNTRATQSSDSYMSKEEFKMPQMRPYTLGPKEGIKMSAMQHKLIDSIDTDLLSLSELWGERGEGERVDRIDSVQLEEERLKREHCEAMIQQLQKKLLEQQEKLAVALKVDRAKDSAIARLKDAWLRITSSLDRAEERHRAALHDMCREVDNFRTLADDAQKKTNHFEAELYKTLDLAHDYQEKCKQLSSEKKKIQECAEQELSSKQQIIDSKDKEIQVLKENYETVMRLNKQSTDCVKNLEDALEKERLEHEQTKQNSADLTRKNQALSDELALLREERRLLEEQASSERARGAAAERARDHAQQQAAELRRQWDSSDGEAKSLRKQLEVQKSELKCHYQRQLEEAVLHKLQEFQKQLDGTERELEREARAREEAARAAAADQLARAHHQHKVEVNVLEEKQREEMKLYRLQLAQAAEKIGLLESKLEWFRRRRGQIAAQLHGVMEAQWRQALLILTGRAHALQAWSPAPPAAPLDAPLDAPLAARPAPARPAPPADFEALSDSELQHYVKLLLTKPPNLDGSGDSGAGGGPGGEAGGAPAPPEEPTSDRADRTRDRARRSLSTTKPPWKA